MVVVIVVKVILDIGREAISHMEPTFLQSTSWPGQVVQAAATLPASQAAGGEIFDKYPVELLFSFLQIKLK